MMRHALPVEANGAIRQASGVILRLEVGFHSRLLMTPDRADQKSGRPFCEQQEMDAMEKYGLLEEHESPLFRPIMDLRIACHR
jgi:hypothetical protein